MTENSRISRMARQSVGNAPCVRRKVTLFDKFGVEGRMGSLQRREQTGILDVWPLLKS